MQDKMVELNFILTLTLNLSFNKMNLVQECIRTSGFFPPFQKESIPTPNS